MMLAEHSTQSNNDTQAINISRKVNHNKENNSLSITLHNQTNSIAPIKIPLVSFAPILATSPNFVLVNEFTKRRNQLILFNENLQRSNIRYLYKENLLQALWNDKQQCFLILTSIYVFTFEPISQKLELIREIIPLENKLFKCFTLLENSSKLLIFYDEWGGEHLDHWQQDNHGCWIRIQSQSLGLTSNEFIGDAITDVRDNCTYLAITIYNNLTEQWRLELRNIETLICEKRILLPESNFTHDYRIISTQNMQPDINWLVFFTGNSDHFFAIDSQWKKIQLYYKQPIQQIAFFKTNYLIIRTVNRIGIHSIH